MKRKTRILGLLLAVVMLAGLLPAAAFAAEEPYDLWVDGVQVTPSNKDNIPITGGGSAKYDPTTQTLELKGVYLTQTSVYRVIRATKAINHLTVKGNGKIINTDGLYGISAFNNLTIEGEFEITARGCGITADNITITNGSNITITSTDSDNDAIYAFGDIVIEGGSVVKAVKTGGNQYATEVIGAAKSIMITGKSEVTATTTTNNDAIFANTGITISDGAKVTASAKNNALRCDGGEIKLTDVVFIEGDAHASSVKIGPAPTTYIISVTNGRAYSDAEHTKEITRAAQGTTVYLKPAGSAPKGKYIAHFTSGDVRVIEWSFTMPASNVEVEPVLADQGTYTIDLTGEDPVTLNDGSAASPVYAFLRSRGETGLIEGPKNFDLDGDGSNDIKFEGTTDYPFNFKFTRLSTNSVEGDVAFSKDKEGIDLPYVVTLKFPVPPTTYTITVNGGKAYDYEDKVITSAEPGDMIYIEPDVVPGKYVKNWTENPSMTFVFNSSVAYFEMPANNVTLTPNYADQTPYTVDLSGGGSVDVHPNVYNALCEIYSISTLSAKVDLDGKGAEDVDVVVTFSTDSMVPTSYSLKKLDTTNLTGTYSITQANTSPYSPINIKFDNSSTTTYTITVNGGKAYSEKECTNEITEAAKGTKVYLKYNTPAANQYVTGYTVDSPDGVDVDIEWEYGAVSYYVVMPHGNLVVTVNTAARSEYVIDLTAGAKTIPWAAFSNASIDFGGVFAMSGTMDLDEDGNEDISFSSDEDGVTITPLATTNISGDWSYTVPAGSPTAANTPYKKITYKFPAAPTTYTITVNGGKAYSDKECINEITEAAKGTKVYLKYKTPAEDQYVTGYTVDSPSGVELDWVSISAATMCYYVNMPDDNLTVTVSTAARGEEYVIDLTAGAKTVPWAAFTNASFDLDGKFLGSGTIDLDDDGNADMSYAATGNNVTITPLATTNLSGDFSYTYLAGTSTAANTPYKKITYKFPAAPTTYTVTFNANGHGTAPTAQTIESGKTATKPTDPTETGWIFGGWYKEAACTNAFNFSTPITGNITLYAKWTKEAATTYTVTFDANGHGTAPTAQTIESGKTATKPTDPTETGWIFGGWYKEAACTNAFDFATPIEKDTTLYAKWTKKTTPVVPVTPDTPADNEKERPSEKFKDVDQNAWYIEYIDYVLENNLMNGVSEDKFAPNATTTRAMIVTMLYRLEGEPKVSGTNPFADVPAGQWYTDAIIWAAENGIVTGYGNGRFGMDDLITREQFAAIMYRYAKYKGYDVSKSADLSGYTDVSSISSYALDAMKWAVGAKLINGRTATTLAPKGSATRAEAAAILMRFIENVK